MQQLAPTRFREKQRTLSRNVSPWKKGELAFRSGICLENNPYGLGEIRARCEWAGGWWDEKNRLWGREADLRHTVLGIPERMDRA